MNIIWSHKTNNVGNTHSILGVYHNDIVHYLSLNAQNQPLSYEIIKHPSNLQNGVTWIDMHASIQWLPTQFAQADIPGMPLPILRKIDAQHTLAFQHQSSNNTANQLLTDNTKMHIAEGLFSIAKSYASQKEYGSVVWFHDQSVIVFAYHNNQLVFANHFHSSNLQEHLYYALLPFHELKLSPSQMGLFVLCDETQKLACNQLFQKFVPQAEVAQIHMPWITATTAPLMHIVSPLIKLASCALPVEA